MASPAAIPKPSNRTVRLTVSYSTLNQRSRINLIRLMRTKCRQPQAVPEKHQQHHADTKYRRRNQPQRQAALFIFQVHKPGDNQPRLNDGKPHQNGEHHLDFKVYVGHVDFDSRKDYEKYPDPDEGSRGNNRMEVFRFAVITHRSISPPICLPQFSVWRAL